MQMNALRLNLLLERCQYVSRAKRKATSQQIALANLGSQGTKECPTIVQLVRNATEQDMLRNNAGVGPSVKATPMPGNYAITVSNQDTMPVRAQTNHR